MSKPIRFSFQARVWLYPGFAGWHFVTVEKKVSDKIKKGQEGKPRRGWGSVPVIATIGKTSWKTSVFPDKKSGAYLLAIKAEVRKKEKVAANDFVHISLDIVG